MDISWHSWLGFRKLSLLKWSYEVICFLSSNGQTSVKWSSTWNISLVAWELNVIVKLETNVKLINAELHFCNFCVTIFKISYLQNLNQLILSLNISVNIYLLMSSLSTSRMVTYYYPVISVLLYSVSIDIIIDYSIISALFWLISYLLKV